MKTSGRVQAAVNRLVKAARQRKKPKPEDIDLVVEGWNGDVHGHTDFIAVGFSLNSIKNRLSDQDLSDCDGSSLNEITNADRIAYARQLLERETVTFDADFTPSFFGAEIKSTDGVGALLVFSVTGYSFSDLDVNCYGVFQSLDDFERGARSEGYNCDISDQEILDAWNK
jgi:hypothetical protein